MWACWGGGKIQRFPWDILSVWKWISLSSTPKLTCTNRSSAFFYSVAARSIKRNHITKKTRLFKSETLCEWLSPLSFLSSVSLCLFFLTDPTFRGATSQALLSVLFLSHPLLLFCHFLFAAWQKCPPLPPLPLKSHFNSGLVPTKPSPTWRAALVGS